MDFDDCIVGFGIILLVAFFIGIGYVTGVRHEHKFWLKYLPEEMNKLCLECAGITHTDNGSNLDGTFTEVN